MLMVFILGNYYCTAKCNTNGIKLDFLFYEVMSISRFNDRRFIAGTILDRTLLRLRLITARLDRNTPLLVLRIFRIVRGKCEFGIGKSWEFS